MQAEHKTFPRSPPPEFFPATITLRLDESVLFAKSGSSIVLSPSIFDIRFFVGTLASLAKATPGVKDGTGKLSLPVGRVVTSRQGARMNREDAFSAPPLARTLR